ncbi:MAG TPA: hypothetical protein PLL10_05775, partial [Elusimicrobiales bacterium]|nr:hypothetical protein [Elusimicrobiales bacterium]
MITSKAMERISDYLATQPNVYKRAGELPLLDRLKTGPASRMIRARHWRKLFNYVSARAAQKLGLPRVPAKPYHLCVDPSTACQLRCPFCFHISGYKHGNEFLDFEDYKALLR